MVKVVLFSGGRGSSALAKQLVTQDNVDLTLLINGYDDGMSTGEVRRFLGDSLGPSDFRKNSTRMAAVLDSAPDALIKLLDLRLPIDVSDDMISALIDILSGKATSAKDSFSQDMAALCGELDKQSALALGERISAFNQEQQNTSKAFDFADCSLGNLIFAGSFLLSKRSFNAAVDDYSRLLGLQSGLVMNITNGENVFLVGLNKSGEFLASEGDIVDDKKRNYIQDFYLLDRPLTETEIAQHQDGQLLELLNQRSGAFSLNPKAQLAISQADIIVYAPGTQHSSLLPSYVTPNLGEVIANNTRAAKLLITNIQEDAEIPDSDALSIIEKAAYYLREKGERDYPVSTLFTHFLINDPSNNQKDKRYIPIGDLKGIDDPRLLQVQDFEDSDLGVHDANKILTPFIDAVEVARSPVSVAVLLLNNLSTEKTVQTVMDMTRSSSQGNQDITVYYAGEKIELLEKLSLPFSIKHIAADNSSEIDTKLLSTGLDGEHDYIFLMECSGMYHGSDAMHMIANLFQNKVDAIWGSRRLSVADVQASYQFRYRQNWLLGFVSRLGSHALSLMYLLLYGHYISDTLSGLKLVRTSLLKEYELNIEDASFNQKLLCKLLKEKGTVYEIPVGFLPMSPEKVKRTSVWQGVLGIWVIVQQRLFK